MVAQIIWFEKNKLDTEKESVTLTVTDSTATNNGQNFVNYVRDRKNYTAWMTTGSNDAAATTIEVDFVDPIAITDLLLIGHNLKNYTIQYKTSSGGAYTDFSTVINPTNDTSTTTHYNFDSVNATNVLITINGTQVADADKQIKQLVISDRIGQFEGWPQVKMPSVSTNRVANKMISGKRHVVETLESFKCKLNVKAWNIQNDLDLLETLYFKREGVLMWINGGSDQFGLDLKGYRAEDIFLVRITSEWTPELIDGIYTNPAKVSIRVEEAIT